VAAEAYGHCPHAAADGLSQLVVITAISHRKQRLSLNYFSHVSRFSSFIYDVLVFFSSPSINTLLLYIVTFMGVTNKTSFGLVIGFIDDSLYNHS
jgi:hypothetical protein